MKTSELAGHSVRAKKTSHRHALQKLMTASKLILIIQKLGLTMRPPAHVVGQNDNY
jgi:hypothetical protein